MFRRTLRIALVVALVAAACTGGSPAASTSAATTAPTEPVVTVSADGSATVEVAAGSPPITVVARDVADLGLPDGFDALGAYELGPVGFDGGATVTVRTGRLWGPDSLQLPIGLLGDGAGEWEVVETATVSEADGEITVGFDVPHFSVLVIAASPWGIDLDPWFVEGAVGERWEAYWDIVDPELDRVATTRPFKTYLFPGDDLPVIGTVRALIEDVDVRATPRSGGAVSFDPFEEPLTGTYDHHLGGGFDLRDPAANGYVEVFSGSDTFTCLSPGNGVYGFQVQVGVDRPDLVFAPRYPAGLQIARAAEGVILRYAIAAPARCIERGGTITSRIVQHFLEFDRMQTQQVLDEVVIDEDPQGGPIYPIGGAIAGLRLPRVDIAAFGGFRFAEDRQLGVDLRFNFSVFGCGETHTSDLLPGIDVITVCPEEGAEVDVGAMYLVVAEHADALPRSGAAEHYTYAVVFESDGDPVDDWEYQDPFDWDFFQGSDRWYQLEWDPSVDGWSMRVSDALAPFGSSGARAVVAGNTILWLVPASEIDGDDPTFRVTAFAHDGTFAAEGSGGDVSGIDPTGSLTAVVDLEG